MEKIKNRILNGPYEVLMCLVMAVVALIAGLETLPASTFIMAAFVILYLERVRTEHLNSDFNKRN